MAAASDISTYLTGPGVLLSIRRGVIAVRGITVVLVIVIALLVLLSATGLGAQPSLRWCMLPPDRTVLGDWTSPTTLRVDLNKDGVAEVIITGFSRSQAMPIGDRIVPVFDFVYLFRSAMDPSTEVEISVALLSFLVNGGWVLNIEGQGCTANVRETLRASGGAGREASFFHPDSAFGRAFLIFYRKNGASDAQLNSLIPGLRCSNPPGCDSTKVIVVPADLLLTPPTPSQTRSATPAPGSSASGWR